MLMPSVFGRDIFDDFMDGFAFPDVNKELYGKHAKNIMKTDVKETEDGYEVIVDLPGFKTDEVKVSLENGYLNIAAEKGLEETDNEKKHGKYIHRERFTGSCERTFYVGDDVKTEDIKGEFKHGILKLVIPKKEEKPEVETSKYISIEG